QPVSSMPLQPGVKVQNAFHNPSLTLHYSFLSNPDTIERDSAIIITDIPQHSATLPFMDDAYQKQSEIMSLREKDFII
ncbi:hypothetical protein P7K49_004482, partial [Saguinus oedipus]